MSTSSIPYRQPPYQVSLPVFEGPLDLLLHLIERQEMDITQVSLARITNQFLEHLARMEERDAADLADFLVVAAKLILIKSRLLLPQPVACVAAEEEPDGEDLVQQLIEYRKVKQAAGWLRELEVQGRQSFIRLGSAPAVERPVDLGGVSLEDLLAVVREALQVRPVEPSVNGTVPPLTITLAEQMERIARALAEEPTVSFVGLLAEASSWIEVIVTLLALLEMVKQGRARMSQSQAFGDITITRP